MLYRIKQILILSDVLCSHYRGCAAQTKGTAYVVYEDIFDAKNACEHLSGFNVCNRYLVVLYYQPHKVSRHGYVTCDLYNIPPGFQESKQRSEERSN